MLVMNYRSFMNAIAVTEVTVTAAALSSAGKQVVLFILHHLSAIPDTWDYGIR